MKLQAVIIESTDKSAIVETLPKGACVGCKGCSHSKIQRLEVITDKKYIVGKKVEIELEYSKLLIASLFAYILPLLSFILSLFTFSYLINLIFKTQYNELFGLFMGIITMLVVLLIVRRGEKNRNLTGKYKAKIINYLQEEICHF